MMRYFFHTDDGRSFFDDEGLALPSLRTAKIEAARLFGELVRDQPEEFWSTGELTLTVTDETRLVLFTLEVTANESAAASTCRSTR